MYINTEKRIPIKAWTDLDEGTLNQALNLASLPFAFRHIAIMPDTHLGYGMPIGGVLATEGVVIPNAVGVDIGCGMSAWDTGLSVEEFMPHREAILNQIQRSIPTGFNRHQTPRDIPEMPEVAFVQAQEDIARKSIGTLGGGNHFIEIQKDHLGFVWVMLHSGSRNVGKTVCDHYNKIARDLNTRWHSQVPDAWQLAFLPIDGTEGQEYLTAMRYGLEYAKANRRAMRREIEAAFADIMGHTPYLLDADFDIHHNYAAMEHHFGRNVMVHRKGAVKAIGQVIIPGSMGSVSYIAEGKSNPESFNSCSHGAGRALGRKEAQRQISVESVIEEMRKADIALFKAKKGDVAEESRAAYKDIEDVMARQADLVRPIHRLTPLGVVKG